jgi:natural product biosynthesis luciferase-like monooxygenase protein
LRIRTYPTPVQPRLPVWVTAANSPRSFEQAGEIGADLLTHLFDQDIEELAQKIALYRAARERNGHDPAAGRVAVALHTFLAATDADVRREAHGAYCAYLKAHAPMLEKLAHSRGVPIDVSQLTPGQLDEAVEWVVEKFLRQRALLGTPEGCTDLVAKLAEIGVQEVACLLDFGPTPEAMLASLTHLRALKERFRPVSG